MQEHQTPYQGARIYRDTGEGSTTGDPLAQETAAVRKVGHQRMLPAVLASLFVIFVLFAVTGRLDMLARNVGERLKNAEPSIADVEEALGAEEEERVALTFRDMDLHPDKVHAPFTGGAVVGDGSGYRARRIAEFREFMNLYRQRQGEDDNFTIRVLDNRSNQTLEVFELESQRERFRQTGQVHWQTIDDIRRRETRRLVDKYAARGIPRANVSVRWGRADQVKEAREREMGTIMYEVQLARYLGLSLLPTEIGTVETFNDDKLVSSVGARSRYQMMPYLLRQYGIRKYDLRTAAGNVVPVTEEWHPLLTMEHSFVTLKGYINAVGHEIPGISAYHTGPGNVFMVYRSYLSNNRQNLSPTTSVMDAYMWAVTDGFDAVSSGTSFKTYSRGYVASGYGALKAMEEAPIDTAQRVLAERVQLRAGKQVYLSQLLRTLDRHRSLLSLRDEEAGMYELFRELNPHIALPAPEQAGVVPTRADVALTATSGNGPVRFFLPLGASQALERGGLDILNERATFVYNENTYGDPTRLMTRWDRDYQDLVDDIGRFGFNETNRARLARLTAKFGELAEQDPSHYRQLQLRIIRIHKSIWDTGPWDQMAAAVGSAPALRARPTRPVPAGNGGADISEAR